MQRTKAKRGSIPAWQLSSNMAKKSKSKLNTSCILVQPVKKRFGTSHYANFLLFADGSKRVGKGHNKMNWTTGSSMLQELGWRSLEQKRVDTQLTLLFKIAHGLAPTCHSDQLRLLTRRSRQMHKHSFLALPCHTN